jgi:hypothetical protein
MSRRLRAPLALLLILLVGVSADLRSVLHAHADWEQELRNHELARVDSALPCDAAPHWDRAHSETAPACAACLTAASALGTAAAETSLAAAEPRPAAPRPGAPAPLGAAAVAPHAGRAPPPAIDLA